MSEILTARASAPPVSSAARSPAARRMAWLDALRGFAAVTVALFHLSPHVIGRERHLQIFNHFDFGKYGVLLFFLVSGYVIPMSLERHGSLRKFWVGRLFRIYPTYLFAIATILALTGAGVMQLKRNMRDETVSATLGQATMLQDFVGVGGLISPFWTLSFEMVFYLVVSALFVWGRHLLSAWWAAGLTLLAVAGGRLLPDGLLGPSFAHRRVLAALLVVVVAASLGAYLSGRRSLVLAAGAAGLCFVLLPAVNGHAGQWVIAASSWQAVLMMGVMFAGTVVYRLQNGQLGALTASAALTVVFLGCVFTNWLHTGQLHELVRWGGVSVAVAASFALGFALRHRSMPTALTWLGAISFSVYLLHVVVLNLVLYLIPAHVYRSDAGWLVVALGFAGGTLVISWLVYRFVEQPGQNLGRRVQQRAQAALGPEQPLRPPAARHRQPASARTASGSSTSERTSHSQTPPVQVG